MMKRINLLEIALFLFFSIGFISCNDDNVEDPEQPILELDKNSVSTGPQKDVLFIKITANGQWKIADIPEWISIDTVSGNDDTQIKITTEENREPEGREAILQFMRKEINQTLTIKQFGQKDVVRFPELPIFRFSRSQYELNIEKTGKIHNFKTDNLFVNPDIKDKIYLGNLISHNAGTNTSIPVFPGYTFNPITVWLPAPVGEIKTYVPSWTEQNAFAQRIIAAKPKQTESFTADNGTTEFYTHEQLYVIGVGNLGVKLDEFVSGSSYTEKEMTKKYGLIFCFRQVLFSLYMDMPEKLIKEELKEADKAQGISYINGVNYGKIGLLIVESDTDSRDVKIAINKVIADAYLSAGEAELINAADISYVYFDNNNKVQIKKGKMDAINAYKDAGKDVYNIYPVGFCIADCVNHSLNSISFSFKIPNK